MTDQRRVAALVAITVAAALLVVALLPLPAWLEAAVFVPVVLFACGYGVRSFLPGPVGTAEAAVYGFAFSVAATLLGGLVLQTFVDLNRTTWTLLVISIAAVSAAIGVIRGGGRDRVRALPVPALAAVALLVLAAAVAGGAIGVASDGDHDQTDRTRFATLWAVPASDTTWTVGVENHGDRAFDYRLEVTRGESLIADRPVALAANQSWTTEIASSFPASAARPLIATLYRDGRAYRRVALDIGADA